MSKIYSTLAFFSKGSSSQKRIAKTDLKSDIRFKICGYFLLVTKKKGIHRLNGRSERGVDLGKKKKSRYQIHCKLKI